MRTAEATLSMRRWRTSIARASPESAASKSDCTGCGWSVGHCRATADPEATISRQPCWPQEQGGPFGSTGM